jgi:transposase
MRKVREVLRLHYGAGLSARQIARSCNIARSTVGEYIERAKNASLSWPLPDVDDTQLEAILFRRPQRRPGRPLPPMSYLHTEMRKKGVTLQLLWHEYKQSYPDGYQYTHFCEYYRKGVSNLDLTLRQEHRAGEKMFAD